MRRRLGRYRALVILLAVGAVFSALSPRFLDPANLVNIVVQCASVGIVATGMTFVLLTPGIDLSVGAIMFVPAAVAGKMAVAGASLPVVFAVMLAIGALYGAVNAFFVTKAGFKAFVVTLSTLYIGRGLGLWITETRALNLPETMLQVGIAVRLLGLAGERVRFEGREATHPLRPGRRRLALDRSLARAGSWALWPSRPMGAGSPPPWATIPGWQDVPSWQRRGCRALVD